MNEAADAITLKITNQDRKITALPGMDIEKLIKRAKKALEHEIEAVQKNPRREVLAGPELLEDEEEFTYRFEYTAPTFEHVDDLHLVSQDPPVPGSVLRIEEKHVVMQFEKMPAPPFVAAEVEWINDFVLRRTLDQLEALGDTGTERLEEIFGENGQEDTPEPGEVFHDGMRNEAQQEAIIKAMINRATYVWGPPGTGKTATLGYIIANYMARGKSVLFASNTNRAVDVGLLSALAAMQELQVEIAPDRITRFGDPALESNRLSDLTFDSQIERRREAIRREHQSSADGRLELVAKSVKNLEEAGKKVPAKLKAEYETLLEAGGEGKNSEAMREELEQLTFRELNRKKLIATTLARVCTSDLLPPLSYDAVVIDEASMANIPYLLVLAAKSRAHIVFAGDPMQLPPIATTTRAEHRSFLETDVYSLASSADSMEALFTWKDAHPAITCFFDTQYRLENDLAEIISDVFYDGRLKSGKQHVLETQKPQHGSPASDVSVHLVDTSRYDPFIETPKSEYGFRPVNEVHRGITLELVKRLMLREHVPANQIGIIVPFRSVVWDYRKALYGSGYGDVEVGTIHTFQGREKEAILFDSVMSGQGPAHPRRHFSVRPFDETKNGLSVPRLLNVAFSRARSRMVVLADMQHIERVYTGKFLGSLLHRLRQA